MPQFDRTTMRFVVTIALLYCALIASGFWIFWRCLHFCGRQHIGLQHAGYALMVIALLHGVAVVLSYLSASDGSAGYHLDRWKANGAAGSTYETR